MAYDELLAERVRKQLKNPAGLTEKKMFGGVAFMINGNISVGVHGDELVVRIAPDATDDALEEPGARPFDITGRPMKGWLLVGGPGIKDSTTLKKWVRRGVAYASALPKK